MIPMLTYSWFKKIRVRWPVNFEYSFWIFMMFALAGCTKFVQVPSPTTSLTSGNVYSNDATAASVLTGVYTNMAVSSSQGGGISSLSLTSGLSADELTLYGGAANSNTILVEFYLNQLSPGLVSQLDINNGSNGLWSGMYEPIYIFNIALERLSVSGSLTPVVRQQLTGEAMFLRAFFYFYLVNLYGDVPLTLTSDYTINSNLARTPKALVYQQIIADLKMAKTLLSDSYVASDAMTNTTERLRPNKWVAAALLARTYLYNKDYTDAQAEADTIINQSSIYTLDNLNDVFLKNSTEAIWQLQPVNTGWNTEDARVFILPSTGPTSNGGLSDYPVYLSSQLISAFESNDLRRTQWVDSVIANGTTYYYPYKYKSATLNSTVSEYTMVLRLGEQYLIRAEARAMNGNIAGAQADLNAIRTRAGLASTFPGDATSLLNAIIHERQTELFTEWGHRWLDLKRTGQIDNVMQAVAPEKGITWNSNWQYYPIPLYDITQDPNLVQNAGY